jgi:hypothetical protein
MNVAAQKSANQRKAFDFSERYDGTSTPSIPQRNSLLLSAWNMVVLLQIELLKNQNNDEIAHRYLHVYL